METRGPGRGVVAASGELTIWAATQAPHEVRLFSARLLGLPEHRVRVIMRDIGGGFGQKVMPLREDMCVLLAARKAAGRAQVDRGPPGEPACPPGRRGTSTATRGSPSTPTARSSPPRLDHVQDVGAYPTPWPVGTGAAVGMLFPGPYRVAGRHVQPSPRCSPTPSAASPTAGPWTFESLAREVTARHRRPPDGHRPGRAAPAQPAAPRRDAVRQPERHALRPTSTPLETFEQALAMLDYDGVPARAGRGPGAGPLPRRRHLQLRRADDRRHSASTPPRARRSGSSRPARSTSTWPAARPATAWRRRSVQLTADALGVDIADVHHDPGRHRGHAVRRRHRRQPQRLDDRRRGRRRRPAALRQADHRDRRPPAGGVARTTSSSPTSRARVRGDPDGRGVSFAEIADIAYFQPYDAAAGDVPPAWRPAPATAATDLAPVGQRHPRVHLRGRRHDRRGDAAALHRQRGLRPDDQPERGRGADRRRRRAGHRRRAARAARLRRGRQPASPPRSWTTCCRRRPRCR